MVGRSPREPYDGCRNNLSGAGLSGNVSSDEGLRVIELVARGQDVPTIIEWMYAHVDHLTGLQPATLNRYRSYDRRRRLARSEAPECSGFHDGS
jgi:hypothetical protein